MFREAIKQVQIERNISQKEISSVTGIYGNRISEYLTGKRDMTGNTLWNIIEAMEEVSPGAKQDILVRLGKTKDELEISYIINNMDSQKLGETLYLIAQTLQQKDCLGKLRNAKQHQELAKAS